MARRLSRDEVVEKGYAARALGEATHEPWIYYAKCKVGRRPTHNVEKQYYSIPHLMGDLVERYAREDEAINIYGITRVMRSHIRMGREDI